MQPSCARTKKCVQVLRTQIAKSIKYKNGLYDIVKAVCAPTWARTRDQKIMSLRQRVKREIFLRAENFVSDLLRPIYNKILLIPRLKKNHSDEIPTLFAFNSAVKVALFHIPYKVCSMKTYN